ncbi:MAG: cellulase family glycosylhydrolase [Pseudobutyrivibrio sp.]|nr:cellulase family glycosylhydrolase [Pseudobutyrivibrio sp.]
MVSKKQKFRTVILVLILAAAIVGGVFAISYYKGGVTLPWELSTGAKEAEQVQEEPEKPHELVVRVEEAKPETTDEDPKPEQEAAPTVSKLDYYGPLAVYDSSLVDSKGNPAQLTGVSSHGLSWFPEFITADSIKSLRENWGINVIRLAMYTSDFNGYCVSGTDNQQVLKDKIDEAVKAATDNQMYVIIDWHTLNDNNPNTYKSEAIQFFGEMVRKYQDNENVIYEICNEPNGDTTWADIKAYANEVIPVIRNVDRDAIILVGTPSWSSDLASVAADPLAFENIMYTYHFYAASHKTVERDKLVEALDAGLPVFISEYGYVAADGNGSVDTEEATKWNDVIRAYNLSSCIWNLSNKDEGSALISAGSDAKVDFTYDDLSEQGKFFYDKLVADKEYKASNADKSDDSNTDKNDKEDSKDKSSKDRDSKDKNSNRDSKNKDSKEKDASRRSN